MGAALFERRHRALALTEAGRIMRRAVEDSLERLRDAAARVRSSQGRQQVTLTCTPGFASFWLIPRLARFTASGRLPLLADLLRQKKLVAPFRSPAASLRGYFVTFAPQAAHNPSAHAFADWLVAEAEHADAHRTPRRT